MIVSKLTISYDRGTSLNKKSDIGTHFNRGDATLNGGIVRGLGSHFRSQADMVAVQARDKEAKRVYRAFRSRFLTTTIDGLFIVPKYGEAKAFIASLSPMGIDVRVAEFELTSSAGLDSAELSAWGAKVKRQLSSISLGRKGEADVAGVNAIGALADCPLLTDKTRDDVKNLVSLLQSNEIDRAGFKKRLEDLEVEINQIDEAYEKKADDLNKKAAWIKA